MLRYRSYAPAAILLVGCAFIWNARSQASVKLLAPLSGVMDSVPGYHAVVQKLSDDEQRVAGMSQYSARMFMRDSVPVFTTFVSYYERQTQGKTIHSPRNCLPGAGWEVLSASTANVVVSGHPYALNKYLLRNKGESAVVYYWYQGRGRIVANEYAVKWNLLRDAAVAGHTEESLVRVVVYIPPTTGAADGPEVKQQIASATVLGADIAAKLAAQVAQVLPKA